MARIRPRTAVRSGPSTVSGSGATPLIATGTPQASPSDIDGSGSRILTASGVLAASVSEVVGASGYSLNSVGVIPFSYSTPAAPAAPSTIVTVTPSNVADYFFTDNAQITLSAGAYGDLNFAGDDQSIIIAAGCTIATLQGSGTRQHFEMVPARSSTVENITSGGGTDRYFRNIYQISPRTAPNYQYENNFSTTRLAIIGCYLDSVGHSAFMGNGGFTDVIFANNYVNQNRVGDGETATQAGPRIHNVSRLVVVDNRMRNETTEGSARQSFRLHIPQTNGDMINVFASRNEFVGSGIQLRPNSGAGVGAGMEMRDLWLTNNTWYHTGNVVIRFGSGTVDAGQTDPEAVNVVYTGNRLYSQPGESFPGEPAAAVGWTTSDNATAGPYQAPEEWVWQ